MRTQGGGKPSPYEDPRGADPNSSALRLLIIIKGVKRTAQEYPGPEREGRSGTAHSSTTPGHGTGPVCGVASAGAEEVRRTNPDLPLFSGSSLLSPALRIPPPDSRLFA